MNNIKRILLTITFVSSVFQTYSKSSTEVGTLPGSIGVAPNGAATYTIPIELPQGRGNMTPSIALNYNSLSGHGILGKGWGLSGWSYVERVAETKYHDGQLGIMDFNSTDGLMLDGNRLIKGDNYYRTEADNFARITSTNYGQEKDGKSSYFTAEHTSGITKYYGSNELAKSRQYYGNNANIPIRWHLDVVEDRFGNKIKYYYDRNPDNGELYIKEIHYDFDYNNPDNAYYKVAFLYEDLAHNHISSNFYAYQNQEYRFDIRKRLIGINLLNNQQEVLTSYTIIYEKNGLLEEEVVKEVMVDVREYYYYPSTKFDWSNNNFTVNQKNVLQYDDCFMSNSLLNSGDFNGDGITDIIESKTQGSFDCTKGTYIRINDGTLQSQQYICQEVGKHYIGDFDGDGSDELFIAQDNGYKLFKFISTAESLQIIEVASSQVDNIETIGDFNGDMVMDVIIKNPSSAYSFYPGVPHNINEVLTSNNAYLINGFDLLEDDYKTGNFSGNGSSSFISYYKADGNTYAKLFKIVKDGATYNMEIVNQNSNLLADTELLTIDISDFNGDNKDDLLVTSKTNGSARSIAIFFSNGNSFTKKYQTNINPSADTAWYNGYFMVGDINNDGRSDIFTLHGYSIANNTFVAYYKAYFKLASVDEGFKSFDGQAIFHFDGETETPEFPKAHLLLGDCFTAIEIQSRA
jgi:hypothetical protein